MKVKPLILIALLTIIPLISCRQKEKTSDMNIIFLHHSTGAALWKGKTSSLITKSVSKISSRLAGMIEKENQLPLLFKNYNKKHAKNYLIKEMVFPEAAPYGWSNYPYDYYNIWVKNAGDTAFMEEPTLEMLTKKYQVIIFKHCFPVCNIMADEDSADINSDTQTLSNYKLQYIALRNKMHKFPNTKFILFTGATQVKSGITDDQAERAKEFHHWVVNEWDLTNDNIYLWDLYSLQTEGTLYFRDKYATSVNDAHPNEEFAGRAAKLLFSRIIDIIENQGKGTRLTGELI